MSTQASTQAVGPYPPWIQRQLIRRGIDDPRVLDVMARIPREAFVPADLRGNALVDAPIPIGCRQTVSQPYVVARSLQALRLTGNERVLDVGTGSGYQAALLSHLAGEVYSIEVHQRLFTEARQRLGRWMQAPVHLRCGDGSLGWPEAAPFDAIVSGACAPRPPPSWLAQLAPEGRIVLPVGNDRAQGLYRISRSEDGRLRKELLERVLFVPLVGKQGTGFLPDE